MNRYGNHKSKMLLTVMITLLMCFMMAWSVQAGEGDGSGGGKTVPLGLASSTPSNGQTGVELQPLIKLTFNKNVINLAIRDANKKCFTMVTSAGSVVPIEVIMADDQLYPEEKRNISVKPLQALQPGTAYTLKILPELQAKNGTSLGHEVTLNFVTEGTTAVSPTIAEEQRNETPTAATAQNNEAVDDNKTVTSVNENTDAKTESKTDLKTNTETESSSQIGDQPAKQSAPVAKEQQKQYAGYLLVAGIILLAAAGFTYYRKK